MFHPLWPALHYPWTRPKNVEKSQSPKRNANRDDVHAPKGISKTRWDPLPFTYHSHISPVFSPPLSLSAARNYAVRRLNEVSRSLLNRKDETGRRDAEYVKTQKPFLFAFFILLIFSPLLHRLSALKASAQRSRKTVCSSSSFSQKKSPLWTGKEACAGTYKT